MEHSQDKSNEAEPGQLRQADVSGSAFCVRRYVVKQGGMLGTNTYRKTCGKGEANHADETGRKLCGKCFGIWFRKRFKHHPSMEDWYHYHHGPGHSDYEVYCKPEHKYSDDQCEKKWIIRSS